MLRSIALELTLPMVYHTCISDLHNMCFKHLKLMLTDRLTDICTSRAAFAAENKTAKRRALSEKGWRCQKKVKFGTAE